MCNPGEVATGGGTGFAAGDDPGLTQWTDPGGQPNVVSGTPTGWFAEWVNGDSNPETITVYVVCASP